MYLPQVIQLIVIPSTVSLTIILFFCKFFKYNKNGNESGFHPTFVYGTLQGWSPFLGSIESSLKKDRSLGIHKSSLCKTTHSWQIIEHTMKDKGLRKDS